MVADAFFAGERQLWGGGNPDLGFGGLPIRCEVLFLEREWRGERQAGVGTTCLPDLLSQACRCDNSATAAI